MTMSDMSELLEVKNLFKEFPSRQGRGISEAAVTDVSLIIPRGQTYSLVGETGCGKTTTSRMILRLIRPTNGSIHWNGQDIWSLKDEKLNEFRSSVQAVFQDTTSSMNPRMRASQILAEPLLLNGSYSKTEIREAIGDALESVELSRDDVDKFPHEFSGGQRQRLALARALTVRPSFVVLDEPISGLDVSVGAQIMTLLRRTQEARGLSYLLIAHNLAAVRFLSDRIGVMHRGRLVEEGTSTEVIRNPKHPYTSELVEAARLRSLEVPVVPDRTINSIGGCSFYKTCPIAMDDCATVAPIATLISPHHLVRCHKYS